MNIPLDLSAQNKFDNNIYESDLLPYMPKRYVIKFFYDFNDDSSFHKEALNIIENARENDEIVLYFSSNGGSITTMLLFLNAINISSCKNITARINLACSAAAFLALCCNNIYFDVGGMMMFHNYSTFQAGKENEISSRMTTVTKNIRNIITNACLKIMSAKEIEEMYNGKDFWFTADEATKRLRKYTQLRKKKHIEEQKAKEDKAAEKVVKNLVKIKNKRNARK